MTTFTGHAGVGLLTTPCPIRDLRDVTSRYASSPNLNSRYLLISGTLNSVSTYIHIVYAPVQPNERAQFFSALPRHFDEDANQEKIVFFYSIKIISCSVT